MPERNERPTTEQDEPTTEKRSSVNRRRVLQVAGAGLLGTGVLTSGAAAQESADRLEIFGAGSQPIDYTFTVDGSVTPVTADSFTGSESDEETVTENDDGTVTVTGQVKAKYGDAFDLTGNVVSFQPKTGNYRLYLNGSKVSRSELVTEPSHRLEITTPDDGSVEYTMTTTGEISKLYTDDKLSAEEGNDVVTQNDDGTWTVSGLTGNGYGDSFKFVGDVLDFSPMEGPFSLHLDGETVTPHELTGEDRIYDREHSYSFEGVGDDWADVYLEVEDGGDMVASTLDGATIDSDYYWISEDGTKAAARVFPDDRDAFQFDNLVLDVTIDGTADAYVDGNESSVDRYPQPGATGDTWKEGFVWQEESGSSQDTTDSTTDSTTDTTTDTTTTITDQVYDREHSYSFEGVGDTWADVYLEVEDGGDMVASTVNGATINPDYYWISEDGTKAAARVFPDDRDAFQFDNLVLDVTIDGTANAYVDGSESSVDRYPQAGATGDDWKSGFSWQDGSGYTSDTTTDTTTDSTTDTTTDTSTGGLGMGGGSGYENIVTSADADYVVQTASGIEDALQSASSGEIVFVAGDAVIDTGSLSMDVPSGVTLASNRGENGAPGALLRTNETPQIMLHPKDDARVTGLRIRGHSPDRTVTHSDGISFDTPTYAIRVEGGNVEVDNCQIWGWPDRAIYVLEAGAHIHHSYIYDNNGQGLGYGVSAGADCLIEYNYFHNNRHSVTCAYDDPGYTARYNHFSPVSVLHICDVHDPFQGDTTIESNIIENGDSRTWDNPAAEGIAGYSGGFDGGSLSVTDNWFFDQGSAYFEDFGAVSDSGNVYGDEGSHDPTAVIPNHPGMASRPWL